MVWLIFFPLNFLFLFTVSKRIKESKAMKMIVMSRKKSKDLPQGESLKA